MDEPLVFRLCRQTHWRHRQDDAGADAGAELPELAARKPVRAMHRLAGVVSLSQDPPEPGMTKSQGTADPAVIDPGFFG